MIRLILRAHDTTVTTHNSPMLAAVALTEDLPSVEWSFNTYNIKITTTSNDYDLSRTSSSYAQWEVMTELINKHCGKNHKAVEQQA